MSDLAQFVSTIAALETPHETMQRGGMIHSALIADQMTAIIEQARKLRDQGPSVR